jgi:hypothetical protein
MAAFNIQTSSRDEAPTGETMAGHRFPEANIVKSYGDPFIFIDLCGKKCFKFVRASDCACGSY